ncbi:unnamed protein product [marine sediment metagenome]|uniref:Uncharacterized protein n=1 Tax=marine sediment metagenome TaxID=412755 RepID=X0UYN8_9ZZZZ
MRISARQIAATLAIAGWLWWTISLAIYWVGDTQHWHFEEDDFVCLWDLSTIVWLLPVVGLPLVIGTIRLLDLIFEDNPSFTIRVPRRKKKSNLPKMEVKR